MKDLVKQGGPNSTTKEIRYSVKLNKSSIQALTTRTKASINEYGGPKWVFLTNDATKL